MKKRADVLLFEQGKVESREKAKRYIMQGLVFLDNERIEKPGHMIEENLNLELRGNKCPYVSRGGYKLSKALNYFNIDLAGAVCMDIGASTGGFTDCMLQNGARKVYAVDVGYGQLDWKLRSDSRVVVMERTNVRYLEEDKVSEKIDFISIDVSFISLRLILEKLKYFLTDDGAVTALIKPQFEAGKESVGKHGVITDKKIHKYVITTLFETFTKLGLYPHCLTYSPIKGQTGNIEFLVLLKRDNPIGTSIDIDAVVDEAHSAL